ncbi:molybdopterin converting factor subunit 1 [Pseudomonadales bacterium]|nr:molybdopterin converting factor subunit 1 [Pseudomonadales bacterium]MDC3327983.1 molybdopterin converting factor subunit 1 [Pseudomonadales bacterium]
MKVLFFAALRETMGQSELEILLEAPTTVAALKSMIKLPNGETLNAASRTQTIMTAVDQEMVDDSARVSVTSEVAFFPPVTGG